jgi:hypothetical protein
MELVSFMPQPLYAWEKKTQGTHCTEGWVGQRASLGIMQEEKISCPYQELNSDSLIV